MSNVKIEKIDFGMLIGESYNFELAYQHVESGNQASVYLKIGEVCRLLEKLNLISISALIGLEIELDVPSVEYVKDSPVVPVSSETIIDTTENFKKSRKSRFK